MRIVLLCFLVLNGCGDTTVPQAATESQPRTTQNHSPGVVEPSTAVTVSMDAVDDLPSDGSTVPAPTVAAESDDVASLLKRMWQLRQQASVRSAARDTASTANLRRQHSLQIVELAADVLSRTLNKPNQQDAFTEAIQQLLEARFHLALTGGSEDVDQLYADVQALNDRDEISVHAAEGIYFLARFAHAKARVLGPQDSAWFENFSRWAREFASRFPEQTDRAVSLLFGAGRSCEVHAQDAASLSQSERLMTEAHMCYVTLTDHFGDTPQAHEAAAVLRRLALPGTRLTQFAGPTLDGGYVNAEDFVDRVTVIYFWDSRNAEFIDELLPLLQQAQDVGNDQLRFVGVTLDDDEAQLRAFLSDHSVPGQQVFFPDVEQRSWDSPLVRFWGLSRSPSAWLVDGKGFVRSVDVGPAQLVNQMRLLFK